MKYPGIQIQRHKRKDGSERVHRYYRRTGVAIVGEPGTEEFARSYEAAKAAPVKLIPLKRKRAPRPRKAGVRYVYFVRCLTLGHVKIGSSTTPYVRFLNIKTACPDEVELLGVIADAGKPSLEGMLHRRFHALRLRGEWFAGSDELLAFIAEHAEPARAERPRLDAAKRRSGAR